MSPLLVGIAGLALMLGGRVAAGDKGDAYV